VRLSKKLCSRLHSIEVDFDSNFQKRKSSRFELPFGRLRGNVRTSSIARWKARVRLPIRLTIELFSLWLLLLSRCRRKSVDVSDF